jgi:hypothetical protein
LRTAVSHSGARQKLLEPKHLAHQAWITLLVRIMVRSGSRDQDASRSKLDQIAPSP